jgi:LysM repeat protein
MSEESSSPSSRPRINRWLIAAVVALVAVVVVGFLFFHSQRQVMNLLQINALQTQRLDDFGRLADQVRGFNARFGARFGRIHTIENLSALQQDIQTIQQQPNLPGAVDSLMDEFKENADKLDYLGDKIERLEKSLGSPWVVKAGDSHADIAMKFLTTVAELSPAEAKKVLKRTALIWELEPGNRVYNLYYDGVFLTTVTQGDAKQSPLSLQQRMHEATTRRIEDLEARLQGADTTEGRK